MRFPLVQSSSLLLSMMVLVGSASNCGRSGAKGWESPYVRVVGELQTYHGTKIVRANNIFAAPNPYEIFEHILKAIQETIICAQDERYALEDDPEQMPDTDIGNPQDASYVSPTNGWSTQFGDDLDICAPIRSMRLDNSGLSAAVIQGAEETLSPLPSSNLANSSTTLHLQDPYLDLSALERDIMQALKHLTLQTEPSLQGFAIHDIFDLVCERTPDVAEATFQNALNFLINEGYIYRPLVNSHCMLNE
ncbi:hypothetical protein FB451DRAFT_742257 [Mycena latifolia]|nr:hypothetical protein FB451DRAFT_742257 [Mycena latifolia]